MRNSKLPWLPGVVVASLLAAVAGGCSRGGQQSSLIKKGDEYFAAGEYDKAEIEYKNAMQAGGFIPRALGQLGTIYLEQGRAARAAGFLVKAVEMNPDDLDVRVRLAHLYLSVGQNLEARDAARFVVQRRPQDPEAPILLAESVAQPRDALDVRAQLQALPQSGAVVAALGLLELKDKKVKEAEALLEKARDLDPKSAMIHAGLARIYWSREELDRADKGFATAAELSPPRSPLRLQQARFKILTGKVGDAKQLLDEMIRRTPDCLPPYTMRASIASSEKKHEESIALLEKVLHRDSEHPDAMLMIAQERLAIGDRTKAIATLERAVALFPQSPQMQFHLGSAYLANGDLQNAASTLAQAVKLAPGATNAITTLAQVHIRQGNYPPAIAALKPLAQQTPPNNEARQLLAEAYQKQENFTEALAIYRQLAADSPKNAQFPFLIGSVLLQQKKPAEARKSYLTALEIAPSHVLTLEAIVSLDAATKNYAAAREVIQKFITNNPREAAAYVLSAKVNLADAKRQPAEADLLKAIELRPDVSATYVMLAQLYIEDKQSAKAIVQLKSALSRNQKDASAYLMLAVLQESEKDYVGARENYEKVLALNPKNPEALNNLAFILSEHTSDLDRALETAQRAKDQMPDHPATADTLGWILYKKKQYARALNILEDSAERLGDVPEVQYHYGMALYMMSNETLATTYLQRALKLSSDFRGVDDARSALGVLAIDVVKEGEGARGKLEQRVDRVPGDPVALYRLARLDERAGKIDRALGTYDSVLKANPSNVKAVLEVVRLLRTRNENAKALELAKNTRKLVPGDGPLGHVLGRLMFEAGEHAAAVGVLQEAARRIDDNADVHFDLAEAAFSMGQLTVADSALQDGLQRAPNSPRAARARQFLELVGAFQEPSRAGAATATATAILKSEPSYVPALAIQGIAAHQKNDAKTAIAAFSSILKTYPNFTPAKRYLAILYSNSRENGQQALEYAAKARETYPSDSELAKAYGIILYHENNPTRAASLLQDSARTRTDDAELMYFLGMAQNQLKNTAAAKRALERSLELGLAGERAGEAKRVIAAAK